MNENLILSLNTGFMVNRFQNDKSFLNYIKKLNISHIQLTTSYFNYNLPKKLLFKKLENFQKIMLINNINTHSIFTDSYTRLSHLSNPDQDIQNYWIKKFKLFIDMALFLGADNFGSHLGISSIGNNHHNIEVLNRTIKNWDIIGEYAYKKKLPSLSWEPMSIKREFGESIKKTININNKLNKINNQLFELCLDVDHGDKEISKFNSDPYNWLKLLTNISYCIHLKQVHKNYSGSHLPFTKINNSKGIIKATRIINLLNKLAKPKKKIYLVLEHSFKERSIVEKKINNYLVDSIQYWNTALKKC